MNDAFTQTYDLHQAAIHRYCLWKSGDKEVSHDLVQGTFLRFWICTQRKEKILNQRALLYRIAHNLFIDHVRRQKEVSLDQLLELGFEPSVDTWHQTYSRLDAERPLKKLRAMHEPYRRALHARFILGMTPVEIASMTGETSNAVSVRIFRGLGHLRGMLQDTPRASRALSRDRTGRIVPQRAR